MRPQNAFGACRGEEDPSGSTCHTSEPAAAPTALWRRGARSEGELPHQSRPLESPSVNLRTRNSPGNMRLRAEQFEGGLIYPCSRLGTVPTGELAAPFLHAEFGGSHRCLGLATVSRKGPEHAWLRGLPHATHLFSGRSTTTPTAWQRRRASATERRPAACRPLIGWQLFGDGSPPGVALPARRRARLCPLHGSVTESTMMPFTPPRGSPTTTSPCHPVAAIAT